MSKFTTKREAQAEAKRLKPELPEPRLWKTRVWDNLGWRFDFRRDVFIVWRSDNFWMCMVSGETPLRGDHVSGGPWTTATGGHATPREAIHHEVNAALEWISKYDALRDYLVESGFGSPDVMRCLAPTGSLRSTAAMLRGVVEGLDWAINSQSRVSCNGYVRNQISRLNNFEQLLRLLADSVERGNPIPRRMA